MALALAAVATLLVSGCVFPWSRYKALYLDAVSDGSGGVFVVWEDENVVYGQRIDSEGNLWWGDGLVLSAVKWCGSPKVIGDGSGGAIIVWQEGHEREAGLIERFTYAQRIDSEGVILWEQGGRPVSGLQGSSSAKAVSDGSGGAIIVSEDPYDEVRVQRIHYEGKPVWSEEGVTVCTTTSSIAFGPAVLADGSGGVTIVWVDDRAKPLDIYAQKISSEGEIVWQENGIPLCASPYYQTPLKIVSGGSNNVIVAWLCHKNVSGKLTGDTPMEDYPQVYAQRLSPDGETLWQEGGVQINVLPGGGPLNMTADGAGGAIIVWHPSLVWGEERFPNERFLQGLRAQRVNSEGKLQWAKETRLFVDVNVSSKQGVFGPMNARVISDGLGGTIVFGIFQTWGPLPRAQKLSPEGELRGEVGGVQLFPKPRAKSYENLKVKSDGSGGVIIVAQAGRDRYYLDRIYAQRIDSEGKLLWTDGGVQVYR
jgi:hypothetical protein